MVTTASLAWYDEPPELLDRCIRHMVVIADRVVAVDGAYARFPGAKIKSPKGQAETIREAAAAVGMECVIIQPRRLWAGQLEKRTFLMNEAAAGSDWVVTVDADHILHGNQRQDRDTLEKARHWTVDAFEVPLYTPPNEDRPLADSAAGKWHADLSGRSMMFNQIFRAYPDYRVEHHHWWLSAMRLGLRTWMWGGDGRYPMGSFMPFPNPGYQVEHVSLLRDEAHIRANRAFCNDRDKVVALTSQEDDRPGLFRPVWDFETLGS